MHTKETEPDILEKISSSKSEVRQRDLARISLLREAMVRGYEGILLVGKSDLDFIVEHLCLKYRLKF